MCGIMTIRRKVLLVAEAGLMTRKRQEGHWWDDDWECIAVIVMGQR